MGIFHFSCWIGLDWIGLNFSLLQNFTFDLGFDLDFDVGFGLGLGSGSVFGSVLVLI